MIHITYICMQFIVKYLCSGYMGDFSFWCLSTIVPGRRIHALNCSMVSLLRPFNLKKSKCARHMILLDLLRYSPDSPKHYSPANSVPLHFSPANSVPFHFSPADSVPSHFSPADSVPFDFSPANSVPFQFSLADTVPKYFSTKYCQTSIKRTPFVTGKVSVILIFRSV